jgi:phosphoribosylpyrophosphate synthetase
VIQALVAETIRDQFIDSSWPDVNDSEAKIHIPESFRTIHPDLTLIYKTIFAELRVQLERFDNLLPLLLTGGCRFAAIPLTIVSENLDQVFLEMAYINSLTQTNKLTGMRKVEELVGVVPYTDDRQDRPSIKPYLRRDGSTGYAQVYPQSNWTETMARMFGVGGFDTLIKFDGHSREATQTYEENGIKVVNITAVRSMIDKIKEMGLFDGNLHTIVMGLDLGNLPLAHKIAGEEGWETGVMHKHRIAIGFGDKSITTHEIIHGDVKGKRVVLTDDMISSAGTMLKTVEILLVAGATEIIICATHAVFAGKDHYNTIKSILEHPEVKIVMVTDTIPLQRPGVDKSLPYALMPDEYENQVKGSKNRKIANVTRKEVQVMSINQLAVTAMHAALIAGGDPKVIASLMHSHVLFQDDPYQVYKEVTGKVLERPRVTGLYMENGEIIEIDEYGRPIEQSQLTEALQLA